MSQASKANEAITRLWAPFIEVAANHPFSLYTTRFVTTLLRARCRKEKEEERKRVVEGKLKGGANSKVGWDKENMSNTLSHGSLTDDKDIYMKKKLKIANDKKKAAVSAWRETKEAERERGRLEKVKRAQERELEIEKEQERHRYLRTKVHQYKAQKHEESVKNERLKEMIERGGKGFVALSKEELDEKRSSEIEKARRKREMLEERAREKLAREAKTRGNFGDNDAYNNGYNHIDRDFGRLVGETKASKNRNYTIQELDEIDTARVAKGAHEKTVGFSGRDLNFGGAAGKRATPSWRKVMT